MTKLGFKLKSSKPTGSLYSAKKLPVHGISNIADWGMKVVYIAGKSILISIVFCWAPNRGTKWQDVFHTNRGNCQSTNSDFYSPGAQWSFVDWGSRVKSLPRFFWWVAGWRNRLPVTIGELPTTLGIQFVCIELFSIQKSSTLGPLVKKFILQFIEYLLCSRTVLGPLSASFYLVSKQCNEIITVVSI